MEIKRKGRRYVKEKSMRINLTIDKSNMDLVDLCCAKRNMNVSELFRTFAREYAVNVLKMNLNDFYYAKSNKEQGTASSFPNTKKGNEEELTEEEKEKKEWEEWKQREKEAEELERLKADRKARKVGDSND